jgi:uncharacterized membrane protein
MDAPTPPPHLTFPDERPDSDGMASLLRRNIEAMRAQRARDEAEANWGERLAARITGFTGSLPFVWAHALLVLAWVAANLGWIPGVPRFDRSFVILATVASVEAIFLSTFVLISQNRIAAIADKRADLDLQINLLAEYEITQLVKLTTKIAERLDIADARDPQLERIAEEVAPETVLEQLDAQETHAPRRDAPEV